MSKHNGRPFLVLADRDLGREAWAQYDAEAEIFTLAASEEHRADEAERMLDREQMIAAKLTTELAEVRKRLSDEPAPRSIRPTREAVLAAEVASLRLDLVDARKGPCACSASTCPKGCWSGRGARRLIPAPLTSAPISKAMRRRPEPSISPIARLPSIMSRISAGCSGGRMQG